MHHGKSLIFAYSGQGSQYHRMGRELYEHDETFRTCMRAGDRTIQRVAGYSVLDVLYGSHGPSEPLDDIRYTGLALLLIQYNLTEWVRGLGLRPAAVLGYSIGEVTAHVVAGSLSFEDGVRLIAGQARALVAYCPPGFMAAVLGEPAALERTLSETGPVYRACRNSAQHWVLAGVEQELPAFRAGVKRLGLTSNVLPVRYGFHSPLIDPIRYHQLALAESIELVSPSLEVISCTYAERVGRPDASYLWDVVRAPVELARAIAYCERRFAPACYLDLGPTGTMATLIKQSLGAGSASETQRTLSPLASDRAEASRFKERFARVACGSART